VPLYLREADVEALLEPADAVEAVEACFARLARGAVENRPRFRLGLEGGRLHVLAAADLELGVAGLKTYVGYPEGARFFVVLFAADRALAYFPTDGGPSTAGRIVFAAVALVVVLFERPQLYPWSAGDFGPARDAALAFKRFWLSRPFFIAPGVPKDRADAVRKAFMDTMRDREFLEEASKTLGTIDPMSGPDMHKLIASVYALPPEVIVKTREIVKAPSATN